MKKQAKRANPLPKAHRTIEAYMRTNIRREIADIKYGLSCMESDLARHIFNAIRRELDAAISQAYDRGFEEGRQCKE